MMRAGSLNLLPPSGAAEHRFRPGGSLDNPRHRNAPYASPRRRAKLYTDRGGVKGPVCGLLSMDGGYDQPA